MKNIIELTQAEIESGNTRVDWAEGLILQLPLTHEGRNSWLLNYGTRQQAQILRANFQGLKQLNGQRHTDKVVELLTPFNGDKPYTRFGPTVNDDLAVTYPPKPERPCDA